ncbi:MAG: ribosomal protein S18-alanine N-acetyltransferase [Gemmatimonadota bacterium]
MRREDVRAVAAIERSAFSTPWTAATFANLLGWGDRCEAIVIEEQGEQGAEVAGYAVLRFVEGEGELVNVAVAEPFRGRGLGSALLDAVVKAAERRGLRHLFLEVRRSNLRALTMYEHRGFQVVGIRRGYYSKPVEDAKIMLLRLSADPAGA